jgi:hypothetical protein
MALEIACAATGMPSGEPNEMVSTIRAVLKTIFELVIAHIGCRIAETGDPWGAKLGERT